MNVDPIIDAIVREMARLIAELATVAGQRAPLADVSDRLFVELVAALKARDVSGKVIADMFGVALRSYQAKMRRLSVNASARRRTLWEAVLDHIRDEVRIGRADVLFRFRYDDEATVRGVLNDLVESGLVYRTGRGGATAYRIAEAGQSAGPTGEDQLVRLAVHRHGPIARGALAGHLALEDDRLDAALARLEAAGRIESGADGWRCERMTLASDAAGGPGAAMVDHIQALVDTVCARLRGASTGGGSTFGYDVVPGSPGEAAVAAAFEDVRERLARLRTEVEEIDAPGPRRRMTIYLGHSAGPPANDDG